MANLNLSEFTEKLFVADADHTFIWDTAASISKRVSRNSWLNSGTLTSDAPVTISQTWNNAAVAFTGLKVNAVSTASASGSLLFDLQVGGVSQFNVNKNGVAILSASGVPQLRMISVTGSGSVFNGLTLETPIATLAGFLVNRSSGEVKIGGLSNAGFFPTFYSNNAEAMRITTAGNVGIGTTAPSRPLSVVRSFSGTGNIALLSNTNSAGYSELAFDNDTPFAGEVGSFVFGYGGTATALSNTAYFFNRRSGPIMFGTNNAEKMKLDANGNLGIGTTSPTSKLHVAGSSSPSITVDNTLATGASQLLFKNTVVTGDTDGIFLNGSTQTGFGGAGSLNIKATTGPIAFHTASVTNALSIAQNGAATFAGSVSSIASISANVGSYIMWGNGASSRMLAPSNGSIQFTDAATTGFNLLQFGGASASFPAIKRSTVRLQAVLANDSGFTNIQGKLTTDTDYTATVVTPTGFLTLYDAQGNAYKVPCVAA